MNLNPLRPIILFNIVEIHLSTILLVFFAILYRFIHILLATYALVLIHELAHVLTAVKLKVKPGKIIVLPFGITMNINSLKIKNPKDEIIIALAGPISNIILALITLQLFKFGLLNFDYARFFITANFSIALINFAPALPLDGGRILRAALTERIGYVKAFNTCIIITKTCAAILIICGTALLIITKLNFSVILISAFLIVNCFTEQRGSKLIMMKEILYSRQKLTETGMEKSGVISIMKDAPARKVLKHLTYNKYYIINIIDEDMNVIASVTETKLIEKLIVNGIRIKASEIYG